ncbi:Armadillo-type fold [Pseudocohnilembus persalinus]|uniref:Armadillo-type fold n=1 Tax=Pseudocohnilembus persalinus TaxID=266149 RepID=A0A0V0QGZ3_PSEPJ|nr:Armadillo-type fold [Pseudocohnilembus persalinus]|eukprot:KRX01471.1 Armadillo-type fold [Pseudocohnilembus persalinus]
MSNFIDLITNALLTYGPNRPQAEQELIQRQNSDYKNYLIECVKIIVDQNYSGPQRQAAGTLIKRTASQMDQNGKVNWDKVDLDIQNHAKNALIKTLIDQDQLARMAAANVIATISAIELPRNQWGDIVRSLSDNTNHQDLNIRKTAITTLGYICESLKETQASGQQAFQLQDQVIEHILMGILNGMKIDQQDEGIKSASLVALRNSIGYLEIYLNKQDVRDFVLKQILDCSTHQNDDIKKEAIMALIEFCKFQYSSLGNYIQNIFNITSNHIQSKNQEISTLAIEIYSSIATEYNDRQDRNAQQKVNQTQEFNQNFLVQIKDQLIQLLLQNFLIESDDDTEPESEIQVSSEQALNAIINSFDDSSALQTFTAFISNTASDSRWIYKQASCLAFGCALEFKDEQQIQQMLFSALSIFINMLKESQQKLVQTAAKFLAKAADLYPNVFLKHPQLQQDLSTIITSLQLSPEISRHVCWVICFLSDALKQNLDSPLNLSITAVIEELLKNALRKDLNNQKDLSLIDCSFMGIMNLIQNSSQHNVSAQYLKHAISHLEQSYNEPQPRKDSLQQGILATIHASILSLCQELGNNQSSDAQQLIETVYKTIMKHFQVIKDVDADGLYVLSALATAIGANFTKYLDEGL